MSWRVVTWLTVVAAKERLTLVGAPSRGWAPALLMIVALPVMGYAQQAALEATLSGTVRDTTGGVLPGVTVVAVNEASGNTFEGVTDPLGVYRIPVRIGVYRITAQLLGFRTLTRTGLEVLVGQQVVVNLEMAVSAVEETVTLSVEAPLIDVSSSILAGNIDPRQMQELPINGRNWMDLAMLVPGSRQNASSGIPLNRQGYSQINIDGQQVTNNYIVDEGTGDDQARFSRDSIAEFELKTNRFDATEGRSMGMIANAITKSGTNTPTGSVGGYFRDDSFNSADKVQQRVLPYSNRQISLTYGGPIVRDRFHIFGNYEFEREPQVLVFSAPGALSVFNRDIDAPRRQWIWGVRGDVQFTPNNRLAVRGNGYEQNFFQGGGATQHPSAAATHQRFTKQVLGTWTTVLNNRMVNVIKSGYSNFNRNNHSLTGFKGGPHPDPFPSIPTFGWGAPPRVTFTGYSAGAPMQHHNQDLASIRDDFTLSFNASGRHDVKTGGEYIYNLTNLVGCASLCTPRLIAQGASAGSFSALPLLVAAFPVWNDSSTWNMNALAPISTRYEASFTDTRGFFRNIPQDNIGVWIQDDWTVSSRLTLNLGLRYDFQNAIGAELSLPPLLPGAEPNDTNNFAPRLGFAYSVNDRTVIRGGYGRFYAQGTADEAHQTLLYIVGASPLVPYDGRPDFPTNPFNGPAPTYQQVLGNSCDLNGNRAGCQVRQFIPEINSPFWSMPYSHQGSIGIQRQIGTSMSYESYYVFTGGRGEEYSRNINLRYDPATGVNYNGNDVARRPIPQFGPIQMSLYEGWSNYHAWENTLTRRMSNRVQATFTYTLSQFKDSQGDPYLWTVVHNRLQRERLGFDVADDLGSQYTLAGANQNGLNGADQRHRAVFNSIWEGPYGLQVSGVYFYGSGQRYMTSYGGDRRNELAGGQDRLRPDGTIVPRNNLVGNPLHRVDVRFQKRVSLGGRRFLDGMVELFNVFNHANYGSYTIQESNAAYGQPAYNANVSYGPRAMQLGFRFQF